MIEQTPTIEAYTKPEAIVLLAGEDPDHRSRSDGTLQYLVKRHDLLTREAGKESSEVPWLFIAGKDYGFKPKHNTIPEAEEMKKYILENAGKVGATIPEEKIACQREGLDTLADLYFTERDLLNPTFFDNEQITIALITDKFHMPRAYWSAKRVLSKKQTGKDYTIYPITTNGNPGKNWKLKEYGTLFAWKTDLAINNMDTYMREVHPFHGNSNVFSMYKQGIKTLRIYENMKTAAWIGACMVDELSEPAKQKNSQ